MSLLPFGPASHRAPIAHPVPVTPDAPVGRPLAFYRPTAIDADRGRPFRRLLVALEPAQFLYHSRRLAAVIASRADLEVDLVCVVDGFREIFAAHNPALLADPDAYLSRVESVVEALVNLIRSAGVSCHGHVVVGNPALELARHARASGADLILLGGHIPGAAAQLQAASWRPLEYSRRIW